MSHQPTLWDSPSATTSPASGAGASPCDSQAGPTIAPSGPDHVPVNLSARQAKAAGLLTSDTSGPPSAGSYASANLRFALVSRLRAALAPRGSTLYRLTWSETGTPALRSISRLVASALPTSASGSTGWQTPTAARVGGTPESYLARKQAGKDGKKAVPWNLGVAITSLDIEAQLVGWQTPTVGNADGGNLHRGGVRSAELLLPGEARLASSAATDKPGSLNPEFTRWLMGYPDVWGSCGATAMQSCRRKPRCS